MLDARDRALRIRKLMDEYERRLPVVAHTDVAAHWIAAVRALPTASNR